MGGTTPFTFMIKICQRNMEHVASLRLPHHRTGSAHFHLDRDFSSYRAWILNRQVGKSGPHIMFLCASSLPLCSPLPSISPSSAPASKRAATMAKPSLLTFFSLLVASTLAADPDMLQDICVADPNSGSSSSPSLLDFFA